MVDAAYGASRRRRPAIEKAGVAVAPLAVDVALNPDRNGARHCRGRSRQTHHGAIERESLARSQALRRCFVGSGRLILETVSDVSDRRLNATHRNLRSRCRRRLCLFQEMGFEYLLRDCNKARWSSVRTGKQALITAQGAAGDLTGLRKDIGIAGKSNCSTTSLVAAVAEVAIRDDRRKSVLRSGARDKRGTDEGRH